MVKGINKQMIVLKIDGNKIYDSACFILKNEVCHAKENERDMLREANRLLAEMDIGKPKKKKRHIFLKLLLCALLFIVGTAIGAGVSFFIQSLH